MVRDKLSKEVGCASLLNDSVALKAHQNCRTLTAKPASQPYNLRSKTKRMETVNRKELEEDRKRLVKEWEINGEVQFVKHVKFVPSKMGDWDINRLPCPNCNIVICKLPGWSCDNICCRNCLYSFCWQCGESLAIKDFKPCNKPGFYLAKLMRKATAGNVNPKEAVKTEHRCTLCPRIFRSKRGLWNHIRIHFRCSICSRGFTSKKMLTFHMREHRNQGFFKCFHNPAVGRKATLRCVESPEVTSSRVRANRLRKRLFPVRRRNGLRGRKKTIPNQK